MTLFYLMGALVCAIVIEVIYIVSKDRRDCPHLDTLDEGQLCQCVICVHERKERAKRKAVFGNLH